MIFSGSYDRGDGPALAYSLGSTAEVPPSVVGLSAARKSRRRNLVSDSERRAVGHIPPSPLSGGYIPYPW